MADIGQFLRHYTDYQSTFKETSCDDRHKDKEAIYLCHDETQTVINFDKLVEERYSGSKKPRTFDAIYVHENIIFCIEFKNQTTADIKNRIVQEKLESGKRELEELFAQLHIASKQYKYVYCVVYKNCYEEIQRYKSGVSKGAVLFCLQKYKEKHFVDEIFTDNVNFFTKAFQKQIKKELNC